MGTNFYYKIPLKKREIENLKKLIVEDPEMPALMEELDDIQRTHVIHIGKRSAGWQFLWDLNDGDYYEDNLNSIKDFFNRNDGYIENEYGNKFTVDEFFNEEINECLYKNDNCCDSYSYHKKHPNEDYYYPLGAYEYISKDGLRFSKLKDFA